jgi:hypothetical protein
MGGEMQWIAERNTLGYEIILVEMVEGRACTSDT